MNQENLPPISTYKPLSDPNDDRLGFEPFAKHIARSIQNLSAEEGYVIGLYGEWGSGKTTILNFIEYHLNKNEKIITLHFNPWLFSETDNLEIIFFDQLIWLLRSNVEKFAQELVEGLVSVVRAISDIVSEVPIPGAKIPNKIVEYIPDLKTKDVTQIKKFADDLLKKSGNRIVIIIDDLDRLTKDEVSRTFKLIKSIADFSNIIYIVAFDKKIVTDALSKDFGNGERYLEKIIQIPIDIPLINKQHIDKYISASINELTRSLNDPSLFNEAQWERIYSRWISPYFKNFRDVIRFVTLVSFEYSAVNNEVDVIDFLILYILKLFEPETYNLIRTNLHYFIFDPNRILSDPEKKLFQDFHNLNWLNKKDSEEEKQRIKNLLVALFPKLKELQEIPSIFSNHYYGSTNQQCRISNKEYVHLYFSNNLFNDQLTHKNYLEIIEVSTNSQLLGEQLLSLTTSNQVYNFFDKVKGDRTLDISKRIIVIQTIFDIGDKILSMEIPGAHKHTLNNIIFDYLGNIKGVEQRFTIVIKSLQQPNSRSLPILFLMELNTNRFRYEEWFDDKHFQQLREHYDTQIETLLVSGEIFNIYDSGYIFVKWYGLEPELGKKFLEDDTNFVNFLSIFESGRIVYRGDTKKYFDFAFLKTIIEPEDIIDRVRELAEQDKWSDSELFALKQFIGDFEQGLHRR